MPPYTGSFIVLEGADGSGKGTQFKLLSERLKAAGYNIEVFDFPRYDQASSHFVKSYLNGDYGPASSVNPYAASLFYALDRYEAAPAIKKALEEGKIVLSNRYVGSNMAHQGSKFSRSAERRGFFIWEENLEYEVLGVPRPNLNIFLRVPAEASFQLITKKATRQYTAKTRDQHEADFNHIRESVATYDLLCRLFPKDFKVIDCTVSGQMLGIPEINELIWNQIKPSLPQPHHAGQAVTVSLDFDKSAKSPPASDNHSTSQNLHRLSGLAAIYLMPLPGVVLADKVDLVDGYYVPAGLAKDLARQYRQSMELNLKLRAQMEAGLHAYVKSRKLKKAGATAREVEDTLQSLVPLAAFQSIQLTSRDINSDLWPELTELRDLNPSNLNRKTSSSDRNIEMGLLETFSKNSASELEPIKLLRSYPRNEFEVLIDGLYFDSAMGRSEMVEDLDNWSYERKYQAINKLLESFGHKALQRVTYSWEFTADYLAVRQLKSFGVIDDLESQPPTPRFGYQTPAIIEQAGLDELYTKIFDLSLELYSVLQAAGQQRNAGYAVLSGHLGRWQARTDANSISSEKIADLILSQSSWDLVNSMLAKVREVHPIIAVQLGKNIKVKSKHRASKRSDRNMPSPKKDR